mmetsp:Transcript_165613/g.317959  ORF Transcript_165613/g.317959 Transcript_165613/m.317959 type:complete len:126 (-) Transcript_165613:233-610(-)
MAAKLCQMCCIALVLLLSFSLAEEEEEFTVASKDISVAAEVRMLRKKKGGGKDDGPAAIIGAIGMAVISAICAAACVVTGQAPDKQKGCCATSTREEAPMNWYCNVGWALVGVVAGIVGVVMRVV